MPASPRPMLALGPEPQASNVLWRKGVGAVPSVQRGIRLTRAVTDAGTESAMKTNLIPSRPAAAPGLLQLLAGPMFGQAGGDHDCRNVIGGGGGESYNRSGPHWLQGRSPVWARRPCWRNLPADRRLGCGTAACSQFAKADFDGDCDGMPKTSVGSRSRMGPSVPTIRQSPARCQLLPAGNVPPGDFDADGDVDQTIWRFSAATWSRRQPTRTAHINAA